MDYLLVFLRGALNIGYVNAIHLIGGVLIFAVTHFVNVHVAMMLVIVAAFTRELCKVCRGGAQPPDIIRAAFMILGGFIGFVCSMGK